MVSDSSAKQGELTRQTASSERSLASYLSTILLVEAYVFLYLLPRDRVLMSQVQQWWQPDPVKQRENQLRRLMKNDLPLGSPAPPLRATLANAKSLGLMGHAKGRSERKPILLIFIGACTGCVEDYLKELDALSRQREDLRAVVVSQDSPENVRTFSEEKSFQLPIIADADGSIARAYNAAWFPRAYQLTASGKIVWMQKTFRIDPPLLFRQFSSYPQETERR